VIDVPDSTPVLLAGFQIGLSTVNEDELVVPHALVVVPVELAVEPDGAVAEAGLLARTL
jgi:hypothetical protein